MFDRLDVRSRRSRPTAPTIATNRRSADRFSCSILNPPAFSHINIAAQGRRYLVRKYRKINALTRRCRVRPRQTRVPAVENADSAVCWNWLSTSAPPTAITAAATQAMTNDFMVLSVGDPKAAEYVSRQPLIQPAWRRLSPDFATGSGRCEPALLQATTNGAAWPS